MRKHLISAVILSWVVVFLTGEAWAEEEGRAGRGIVVKRDAAERFAVLPAGVRFPEGIAANPDTGDIYVATFDFGPNPNKLLRFDKHGHLKAQRDFGGTPLLGLEFNRRDHKVYICNFGASKIQRIAANFTALTTIEDVADIPHIGAPGPRTVGNPDGSSDMITFGSNPNPDPSKGEAPNRAPNALAFNSAGDLFVSDSFQGAIFKIASADTCSTPCAVLTVKQDPLLATAGFPPFGANGLAFNDAETKLFIANTGDDRILRMDVETKAIDVFAESINGADGIAFDAQGHLWVAANQADEIDVLNDKGRVIAKLGDFLGIRHNGTPRGLLFPASLVFVGTKVFVTNLALPLTGAVGGEPEEDVTRWTISRIDVPEELP